MGAASSQNDEAAALVAQYLEEVPPDDPTWRELEALVMKRISPKHMRHYRFTIRMKRVFRVLPTDILHSYEEEARRQKLGLPQMLFHGTTPANAERILLGGFEIPSRPGMFGRGIYFAKDPLKSVRYAQQGAKSPGISRHDSARSEADCSPPERTLINATSSAATWLSNLWQSTFGAEIQDTIRLMLACEVYLGNCRTMRKARPRFEPAKGLSRFWPLALLGAKKYDSVRAPGGNLGCVKVTEYVVYSEHQAIPRYLIEFEQVDIPMH